MAVEHLYVHIPFCRSRCSYCDFSSEALGRHARSGVVSAYLARLRSELEVHGPVLASPVSTIYLGGGTPTVLPRAELLSLIRELGGLQRAAKPAPPAPEPEPEAAKAGTKSSPAAPESSLSTPGAVAFAAHPDLSRTAPPEFTVEANPGTVDAALLNELAGAGVTRLSLGVQSFTPRLRRVLGRNVSQADLQDCLEAIAATGWTEWNLDLIHGIPGQTWEETAADIDRAVQLGPAHISLYDLSYTERYRNRVEARWGADAVASAQYFAESHYARACTRLIGAGYARYEVSNFARPGHECRHNQAYWLGEDYLGLGASAVSTVVGERRTNPASAAGYIAEQPVEIEVIDDRTRAFEMLMLGLRTGVGVVEAEVTSALDTDARDRLLAQGCLERHCDKIRLNPGFLDVCNSVISALLLPPPGERTGCNSHTPAGDGTHN